MILVCEVFRSFYTQILNLNRGINLVPAYPLCMWKHEYFELYTGGVIGTSNFTVEFSTVWINISFIDLQLSNSQLEVFNDTIGDNSEIWDLNFLKSKLNQRLLEKSANQIKSYQILRYSHISAFGVFVIFVVIIIVVLCVFRSRVVEKIKYCLGILPSNAKDNSEEKIEMT